jgi:hypothetical protein
MIEVEAEWDLETCGFGDEGSSLLGPRRYYQVSGACYEEGRP